MAPAMCEEYNARGLCLAFSDEYIDTHFDEIREHRSDIEARQDVSNCTIASLKDDNRRYIDVFKTAGEKVFLIKTDYEQMIQSILDL